MAVLVSTLYKCIIINAMFTQIYDTKCNYDKFYYNNVRQSNILFMEKHSVMLPICLKRRNFYSSSGDEIISMVFGYHTD